MKFHAVIAAGALAAAVSLPVAVPANAQSLIAATSHPLVLPWVGSIKEFFIPESNRRLTRGGP